MSPFFISTVAPEASSGNSVMPIDVPRNTWRSCTRDRKAQLHHHVLGKPAGQAVRTSPFCVCPACDQDHELVAAEARQHRVVAAQALHRLADAIGELQQHFVAGIVAEGVVDALEIVDVGEQQRQLATGAA